MSTTLPAMRQSHLGPKVLRAESFLLLAVAAYGSFAPEFPYLAALGMIALALVMHPARPRKSVSIRAERRSQFVSSLESEALSLRQRYTEVTRQPLSLSRSDEQWQTQRDVTNWIASAESQFRAFPEFKAIFEARQEDASVIAELDACIARLGELRRLCSISRKRKLRI